MEQHLVSGLIRDVGASDAGHVDGEAAVFQAFVFDVKTAAAESEVALVMVEKIAARPADDAGRGVDLPDPVVGRFSGDFASAFGGQAVCEPSCHAATEVPHVEVARCGEFFCGSSRFQRWQAGSIDNERCGQIWSESAHGIEKSDFIHASTAATRQVLLGP